MYFLLFLIIIRSILTKIICVFFHMQLFPPSAIPKFLNHPQKILHTGLFIRSDKHISFLLFLIKCHRDVLDPCHISNVQNPHNASIHNREENIMFDESCFRFSVSNSIKNTIDHVQCIFHFIMNDCK